MRKCGSSPSTCARCSRWSPSWPTLIGSYHAAHAPGKLSRPATHVMCNGHAQIRAPCSSLDHHRRVDVGLPQGLLRARRAWLGCRAAVEQYCPGDSDGRTCAQANREYKAEYIKNRRADEALKAAGVAPKDRAAAVAESLALASAGDGAVNEAAETAAVSIADFDLTEYTPTDGPDIAVDGLVEALDETRARLTDANAQVTSLEEENDRLLKLTQDQTATIAALRERADFERRASEAAIAGEKERAIAAYVVDHAIDLSDPRVHLDLDPQQAANVILALAGGAR